jgi:prevent-host-death family protein
MNLRPELPKASTTVTSVEAKARFSELVKRAENGEEVLVTRHGKVVARLLPANEPQVDKPSLLGAMKGKIWMADDFEQLGPEWDEYVK